jgi:hypothetical protein
LSFLGYKQNLGKTAQQKMDGGKDILHFLVWDYEGIWTYFFAASFVAHAKRATMVGKQSLG